jgi:hypothetical protein
MCEPKLSHTKCANIVKASSARSEKSSRSSRAREARDTLLAREGASERASESEREGSTYERERKRTHEGVQPVTCHCRLAILLVDRGGTNQYTGCPVSFVVYILFLGFKKIIFLLRGILVVNFFNFFCIF